MKKKKIIMILSIIIIFVIVICIVALLTKNKDKEEDNETVDIAQTTEEERKFWNNFLNNSPYISEIDQIYSEQQGLMNRTELLKIALTTVDISTENINEEDINNNFLLTKGAGYKRSREEAGKYLNNLLGIEDFDYSGIETYVENGEYLMYDDDYIYFTEIQLPEKVYIAKNYNIENRNYIVEIYEYIVTNENKEKLNKMLKTGEIINDIKINDKYFIEGEITGDNHITIKYKYVNKEDLTNMDKWVEGGKKGRFSFPSFFICSNILKKSG